MIELFRNYWWLSLILAALVVIGSHALLVKLIAGSKKTSLPADSKKST